MKDLKNTIEKCDFGEEFGEDRWCLKRVGLELIPFVMGVALAGTGRSTGSEWIPAVPPLMDLLHNGESFTTWRGCWGYVKYGLGVATVYADKVVPYICQAYEKM